MIITIPSKIEDQFGDAFIKLFNIINEINNSDKDTSIEMDFKHNRWINPFFILPLYCLMKEEAKYRIKFININSYLNTLINNSFYDILNADNQEHLESFSRKNYLPIVCFSAYKEDDLSRTKLFGILNVIIKKLLNPSLQIFTALNYIIDESVANIKDHSGASKGYVLAQYYPDKKYIDICIADCGKGILQSYQDNGFSHIMDNVVALSEAINGLSTKNLPNAENRGYGIKTSKKMIVKGLDGSFSILTGNAIYFYTNLKEEIIELPEKISWKGTVVAIRMTYKDINNFEYWKYTE